MTAILADDESPTEGNPWIGPRAIYPDGAEVYDFPLSASPRWEHVIVNARGEVHFRSRTPIPFEFKGEPHFRNWIEVTETGEVGWNI